MCIDNRNDIGQNGDMYSIELEGHGLPTRDRMFLVGWSHQPTADGHVKLAVFSSGSAPLTWKTEAGATRIALKLNAPRPGITQRGTWKVVTADSM